MNIILFILFIISVIVFCIGATIASIKAYTRYKARCFRRAVCERAEELMHNFLESPEQYRFDAAYHFLRTEQIKASEVNAEMLNEFIRYIHRNQVAQ